MPQSKTTIEEMPKTKTSKQKSTILRQYVKILKKKNSLPTRSEMVAAGISRDRIRHHYGNLQSLQDAAKEAYPDVFDTIITEEIFTPKAFQQLKGEISKYRRFVVTTAVSGCKVHPGFLESLNTYCRNNDALLLFLPSADSIGQPNWTFDPAIPTSSIVFDEIGLNSNIFLSTIKISAKQIDPIVGLGRIGQRNGSFIFASPKQRMTPVAVANNKMAHVLMTTGAVTVPSYKSKRFLNERLSYIADYDHVLGAIIVEIQDKNIYHFRQIQAEPKSGHFVDLGKYYCGKKVAEMRAEALVLGDLHAGDTDAKAFSAFMEVADVTKPKRIVVHDGFNGKSITHHDEGRHITQAKKHLASEASLDAEIRLFAAALDDISKKTDEVVVVKSNHDEFLDRYLNDGRYLEDPLNHLTGLRLAAYMVEGRDPLSYAVREIGGLKNHKKVRWLSRDEDYQIARIQVGAHGDRGANGSKGSMRGFESAYGNCVVGHAHSPEILRGVYRCGTLTHLRLDYTSGPSSWMQTSCLIYANGSRQLVNVIDGHWRLER